MAIRYSGGTYVNTTFTTTVGTRREIVDGIVAALTTAGFTTVSGGGTGDVLMQSVNSPENLKMNVRLYDPGSGNCARAQIQTTDGFYKSADAWLLPSAGRVFNVIACPYQFFVWTSTPASQTNNNYGTYLAAGVPALPAWLNGVQTEAAWLQGNSVTDAGNWCGSFRTTLCGYYSNYYSRWSAFCTLNGQRYLTDRTANNDYNYSGDMRLVTHASGFSGPSGQPGTTFQGYRWADNTLLLCDPLIAWGTSSAIDECRIHGQLWDAAIASDAFTGDTAVTIGSHNGITMTCANVGDINNVKGTLIVCYS